MIEKAMEGIKTSKEARTNLMSIRTALVGKADRVTLKGRTYKVQSLAGGLVSSLKMGDWLFLEQNPKKQSFYGKLARQGHRIVWILYKNKYIGRIHNNTLLWVVDGEYKPLCRFF